ncbi:hypothetical protein K402DRAFT_371027 [Aulographum hederae CBS 113979]|uniref:N-acetyltransferase domain-containing protein n=1 Tax=Aulographum hederae CBS 113979 TaxID=1176131 RepID=A0A6G1HA34_9PEZI|nr:hypothetical protein K402DRAFT_371027 [Aulographum hederae CBS 113979]
MHIRPATARDIPRLTDITTTSLVDDKTYDYMWPHRHEYPEDNVFWWQLKIERHLYDKKAVFLVVETDPEDEKAGGTDKATGPASVVISYIIWERIGCNKDARKRFAEKNTWLNVFDSTVAQMRTWSVDKKYQRRDGDPARLKALDEASDEVRKEYFSDLTDWWSLELLVTDRNYRRRGAASRLVRWGMNQADIEGLACGVEASVMGALLYTALGFRKLVTWCVRVPGDDDELVYDVMRREPWGLVLR